MKLAQLHEDVLPLLDTHVSIDTYTHTYGIAEGEGVP